MRGLLFALGVTTLLAGCASVTRGTNEQVQFDSEPAGAEMRSIIDYPCGGPCALRDDRPETGSAYMDGVRTPEIMGPACVTPCSIQVARNQDLIVTFAKAGYQPQTVKLGRQTSGGGTVGMAGNILLGGVVGLAVDAGNGAAFDHVPNPLKVVLRPLAVETAPAKRKR